MKNHVIFLLFILSSLVVAQNHEYFPDSLKYGNIWLTFYAGNHEPELDDPLIKAGNQMTKSICKAIKHKDMKYRRYAIGALGFIYDSSAIPSLINILKDTTEKDYFRGDALQSIYKTNQKLGEQYSEQYKNSNQQLNIIWKAIKNKEKWLLQPSEEIGEIGEE